METQLLRRPGSNGATGRSPRTASLMGSQKSVRRRTGTFTAAGGDRRSYVIHVFTWFTRCRGIGGVPVEVEGRRELETDGGLGVTRFGRGRYLIDATGVNLRSRDPGAP